MSANTTTSKLLSPLKLSCGLTLKNRIVMAPLTRARAGQERLPNDLMAEYYAQRASVGLIISEATSISERGLGWPNTPGIFTAEQVQHWKKVTEAVHAKDTPIFLQLWHCGRASHSSFQPDGLAPYAPSPIAISGDQVHTASGKQDYETPREMSLELIAETVKEYGRAAKLAKEAGFDGVEVHGANGYLIDQFLEAVTNQRNDAYGGSLEKRQRFLKEVLEAVCAEWPSDRVGLRLSPNGRFNGMGEVDYRANFLDTASMLAKYNLCYLHVMDGADFGVPEHGSPMTLDEFRVVYPGLLIGNAGYTQALAEERLAQGSADLIAFGRLLISNPDLAERFEHGWPLAPSPDPSIWYSFDAHGYTDFPVYSASQG